MTVSLLERLSEIGASCRLTLSAEQLQRLEQYLLHLARWNRHINLTALPLARFPPRTLDRLIVEPLVAAGFIENTRQTWVDLGSGGGSPAIPLKIVRPFLTLTMVEARARRSAFLRETARELGLAETRVLTVRFEDVAKDEPGRADLVSARGVRADELFIGAASSLARVGGRLLLFQAMSSPARATPGLELQEETPLPQGGVLRIWVKASSRESSAQKG